MAVTAAAVKELREMTNLPMMDCKKALVEADGDQEKAIEILREQYKKIALKRADNSTSEGQIVVLINDDASEGVMVEVQCESAPVAGSEGLQSFAAQCAQQLLNGPGASSPEELLDQDAPADDGTLRQVWEGLTNQIREKIVLSRVARVSGPVQGYVHHDGKNGVLFQAEGDSGKLDILRDVSMHIAALRPDVTNPEDVAPEKVQAERDRLTAEARDTGKPDNIIEKIVDGRMNNFYVDNGVLTLQPFARDDSKSVSQALAENGYKAVAFTRWTLGN